MRVSILIFRVGLHVFFFYIIICQVFSDVEVSPSAQADDGLIESVMIDSPIVLSSASRL